MFRNSSFSHSHQEKRFFDSFKKDHQLDLKQNMQTIKNQKILSKRELIVSSSSTRENTPQVSQASSRKTSSNTEIIDRKSSFTSLSLSETSQTSLPKAVKLNSGFDMPLKGVGTWMEKNLKEIIPEAIKMNCKMIDTAQDYGNEQEIGDVLQDVYKSGLAKREDLFLTTKFIQNSADYNVEESIRGSLQRLQTDYIDLFLVHWPSAPLERDGKTCYQTPLHILWKRLEECVDKKLVRSIGLSNFNTQIIWDLFSYARIRPAIIQVEIHVYNSQRDFVRFCQNYGMRVISYASLCRGGLASANNSYGKVCDIFNEPVLVEISKKYNKQITQIILNWLMSENIIVIPKSEKQEWLEQNMKSDEFIMNEDDKEKLYGLNQNWKCVDPKTSTYFYPIPLFD